MPKKRSETSGDEKPSEINDLKHIDGIGPAIERHLHKVSIYTYAQLAALSPADIAAAVAGISGLTSERIIKQDWIGQARKLALEPMSGEAQEEVEAPDEPVMPPIVSEVEPSPPVAENTKVLSSVVPEPEAVISTPQATEPDSPVVTPIVSQVEPSAPVAETTEVPSSVVPEPEAVISTPQATEPSSLIITPIVSEIELSALVTETTEALSSVVPEPEAVISTPQVTELGSPVVTPIVSEVELSALVTETTEFPSSVVPEPEAVISTPQATEPSSPVVPRSNTMEDQKTPPVVLRTEAVGVARLRQVETIPAGTYTPQNSLPSGQSFDVRLTLDLSDVKIADNTQLSYRVSIYSKNLEEHSRQTIAESSGIIAYADEVTISIGATLLPKGTYRLKAVAILSPATTEPTPQTGLVTSKESDLVLIF